LRPENSGQIQRFLEQHADAVAVIPDLDGGTAVAGGYQFMPGDEQMDGFFYAVLQKSA
jgi:16S rRNA (cytosine967-C5)-methyltransferase